jgi:LacI family transcriptional regulator
MKKITIKDIAKRAGVSPATVSRVLNHQNGVSEEVAEKIMKIAKEMNYSFNMNARILRSGKSKIIGIIIPDISNSFFSKVLYGMQSVLQPLNYKILLANTEENPKLEEDYLKTFVDHKVDGILSAPTRNIDKKVYLDIINTGIPLVFFDRIIPQIKISSVTLDNQGAIEKSIDHLVQNGHKKIGFVSGIKEIYTGEQREKGFMNALKKFNLNSKECPIYRGQFNESEAERATKEMLNNFGITAVVCSNNKTTVGALRTIKNLKLRIKEDISIIGFDLESWSDLIEITIINQPQFSIGMICAQRLLREIDNKNFEPENIVLTPELIIRNSVKKLTE